MLCELDLAVERWYTLSPLYAFTSLVSLTVTSCVSCFLHSTVVVRTMIAVKSLHHPTNHCLSHPSLLPPRNPGTELIPASDYNRPLVPSLGHYTSCPFKPGLSIDVMIIILPTTWSYPVFPLIWVKHSAKSCNCRFLLAQRPCLFYFVSKSLLFRPFMGLLAGVVAFPLDGPFWLWFKVCCFRSLVHLVRYGLSVDLSASSGERRRKITS